MEVIRPESHSTYSNFDHLVGKIAGGLFSIVSDNNPQDHMCLLPALTFKVRSRLSKYPSLLNLTFDQIQQLGRELLSDTDATLRFFEYEQEHIDYLIPEIESALSVVLRHAFLST